jgi:hypothetical protein
VVGDGKSTSQAATVPPETDQVDLTPDVSTEAVEEAEAAKTLSDQSNQAADSDNEEPPFTPLEFKIPEEVFREAKLAEAGTPESFWSYGLYRGPGEDGSTDRKVKVHYCKSRHTTDRVLQQYFMNEKVLGFDLEWSPSAMRFQGPRHNVSLVQIASPSRIALFHVALYPRSDILAAPSLKKIMEDPGVTKVGVAIKGDCTRLSKFLGIESRGVFELSHLFKLVKYSSTGAFHNVNKKLVSLATQAEECLRLPLFKGQDVRSSDWTQPLQMEQIICECFERITSICLCHLTSMQTRHPMPMRLFSCIMFLIINDRIWILYLLCHIMQNSTCR